MCHYFHIRTDSLYNATHFFAQIERLNIYCFQGPDVSDNTLSEADILRLPDYRRKHLFFKPGKIFFGIPERPEKIPRTTTVRLNLDENDKHYLDKEKNFGLSLDMMTASAISVSRAT